MSSFHVLEQSTLLKQFINAVFFSFEYENRQFHVITCSLFLNDLYFLWKKKKKNAASATFIERRVTFYIHLFQLRLLLRRMMHDPCFIARGALL